MKKLVFFSILFTGISAMAQDTLYKRNSTEIIVAKVIEISTSEIKYKRFDMLDGALFVVAKNDIEKIKYQIGLTETFSVTPILPPVNPNAFNQMIPSELIEIYDSKGHYMYHNKKISISNAFKTIDRANMQWHNKEINMMMTQSKQQKVYQYISGFSAIPLGYATLFGASYYSNSYNYGSNTTQTSSIGIVAIGTLFIVASQVLSNHFKKTRIMYANKATEIYNKTILNP